ncbi:uncharacterized protein LOC112165700 [Rosa chinensis]|nr:uncharacterized protein LOC112165700 [Rosa chinensis]XP_024158078.2 uncharacterized protein LOC112165700 [Rosa chinensis]XP_040361938.1 uncharacterized protein LOC112165700 [Rosa chinensis]XP_040361939.1 uncharacterized protein LOC112165700 [Rosa chinensis]XP_040361940.1 uncharacterized protein LOC112165700 [Rosa chinensis]XP_040361942.1 uncharacterized protein LOC112165700 [Rosa chinensis]XP_040361943.1 uncharacterized protein LOC112165700 [Rosa chinensis]XP_040361944.1 uncharacterized p
MPWMLIGDFNELVSSADKNGGSFTGKFGGLRNWINRNAMIDMGFQGSCFTWSNNRVKERLDRGFCNCSWRSLFDDAFIRHLPKTRSDHCPIVLQLCSNNSVNRRAAPFRFQAMWFSHANYNDFVSSTWNSLSGNFSTRVQNLSIAFAKWNKEVFGHLFQKKKNILARIGGIQKAKDRHENLFLLKLEADLIQEYESILNQENLFWRQKFRDKWLQGGDRNTRFFHLTTLVRRRRNKIEGLYDSNGNWYTDSESMKRIAVDFFTNLFSLQSVEDIRFTIPWLFPNIDQLSMESLCRPITLLEAKNSLFAIGGLKAPGYDGFPAIFYQHHWQLYSCEIFRVVIDAFNSGIIPPGLNHTVISLIPKVDGPQHMANFRPISLCSTIYKVISKIIVARIRPLMQQLISPNQVSYVPGRNISDNVMIAQEMLFKFKKSCGGLGFFAWKVDLSKAYDRLSWQFIEMVLYEAQFPHSLVKLIMSCITSTSFQICFNGELTSSFHAQRGIRQGDPLSPYIFVLCMEKLSHLIHSTVDVGLWRPVRASQSGPKVSHLFFADDLMLFAEASPNQAAALKNCLDIFCSLSGQAVSYEKSLIYCSPNTCKSIASAISRTCGSPLTNDLGKYLGMPLIHSRVNKHTYNGIFDKVQNRLSSWKSKALSMAGRLTLVNSVTSSIPIYTMQTAKLPMSLCDKLDKLNRDFIWGDTTDRKKIHLVSWDVVCQPKQLGGLGIKKTEVMNQAMLAKASWRLFINDSGLWANIYSKKYLKDCSLLDENYLPPSDCSSTWRSIVHGASLLKKNLKWRVGDGKTIKFWSDSWILPNALINFALPSAHINPNATICDFWNDTGWDLDLLSSVVPNEIISLIINVPTGFEGCGDDTLIWGATSNGCFTVKSAYSSTFDFSVQNPQWKTLWKLNCPPKLMTFIWTVFHRKLLTNMQRVRRGLTTCATCPLCLSADESLIHLFRDCPRSSAIWRSMLKPGTILNSFSLDWNGWIAAQLHCHTKVHNNISWCNLFVFVCWYIWKWRNKQIFDPAFTMPIYPLKVILDYADEWMGAQIKAKVTDMYSYSMLCWLKPSENSYKLNIDGTRVSPSGKIGAGGVIRDHLGLWITGFQINLGSGDILEAEAWGLYYGLKLATKHHSINLVVESDSAILVQLMLMPDLSLHPLGSLLNGCKLLMSNLNNAQLTHVFRECNMLADALAKNSINHDLSIITFESPPIHAAQAYLEDIAAVSRVRRSGMCYHT